MLFRLFLIFLLVGRRFCCAALWLGPIFLSKKLRTRLKFELEKKYSTPFSKIGQFADVAFEVSSEGELEQARPLIDYALEQGQRVEIIYSSSSVENKCCQMCRLFPDQLRLLRLPLLVFWRTISSWSSSKHLILCRYDFYPQLLLFGINRRVSLISATMKNKEDSWFFKNLYTRLDHIVAATESDRDRIKRWSQEVISYDFRIIQITKRLKLFSEKWNSMAASILFERLLVEVKERIILGSCWPIEMDVFDDRNLLSKIKRGEVLVTLAPHKLEDFFVEELITCLRKRASSQIEVYHISPDLELNELEQIYNAYKERPGIFLTTIPGILCELYSKFDYAYVGGGFGRSIHSVLEPYLAGASVICGPKTFRSTEFDLINERSPHRICKIDDLSVFYKACQGMRREICHRRQELIDEAQDLFHNIAKKIIGERNA